jgi:hypothetical protein
VNFVKTSKENLKSVYFVLILNMKVKLNKCFPDCS